MGKRAGIALGIVVCLGMAAGSPVYAKKKKAEPASHLFQKEIPKQERIQQALNRLTFGPRPGDAARVKATGLKKWIDLELHPDRIPENPVLAEKLKALDSLAMTSQQLVANYPPPQLIRQMLKGKVAFPADPDRRMMVEKVVERFERRQKQNGAPTDPQQELAALLTPEQIRALRNGPAGQRLAAFEALPPETQNDVLATAPGMLQPVFAIAPPELRRKLEMAAGPQQVVARDLSEGKLLRAIYSNRQLEEVLTDFWFNHFNVYLDKGADHWLVTSYERDVIRPHVLGKFRDLLEATAQSPAMLFYLDNWQSVGANSPQGRNARRGLNENYGRELMELHTLGVDGGYTQKDVIEVARCFTGWTIERPQLGGKFVFNPKMHDQGEKIVLGVKIPAGGGIEDGERVLDILARHPSTAHFISRKLAQRFVADDPPASLVNRMADTFLKTDGDLRAVLKTMLDSREFWSEGAYRTKMKSPLEMVASAVRASGGDVDFAAALVNQVAVLGEPLYRKEEPTGYSNSSAQWMNSAGLLARMNFALNLAANRVPGVKVETAEAAGGPAPGISLGSPEFQRH
ncbi:MAG TPA: DUF1800 domain-containing protein [Bryobacteraceae bacterium]|nr:DUF1800 domain-containing protein [Bryobacteraceae bacterium]